MKEIKELTAIIEKEGDGYVALCPELDIASQGETIEEARANLIEAIELFYETASSEEIKQRFHVKGEEIKNTSYLKKIFEEDKELLEKLSK